MTLTKKLNLGKKQKEEVMKMSNEFLQTTPQP